MKNKTSKKSQIKLIVIALALLLCFALAVGITTAFYKANRQAIGYVNMDKGLLFEVENMKSADNDTLLYYEGKDVTVAPVELTTTGKPNEYYYIANPTITPLEGTVPYAVRGYLEYVFYDNTGAERTVDELGGDLNTILNKLFILDSLNSPISFGENWLHDSRTNYYYNVESMTAGQVVTNIKEHSYEVGGTSTGTTKVFAEQTVNGEPIALLTLNDWKAEFGGPIVNNIEIGKFTVKLNLEVLQYNEMALMSEWDMSKTYYDDEGNVSGIQGNQITLKDGDEIGNGVDSITFEETTLEAIIPESGGSVSLNAGSFSDKVNVEEITLTGAAAAKTTIYIGSKAFYNCVNLKMNLSGDSNIEYIIATDAFSTGATITHGGVDITNLIVNPSTSGKSAGVDNKWLVSTNIYLFLPNSTLTPSGTAAGAGQGSISSSTAKSYGTYEYTDDQGTWYFDLIDSSGSKVTLNQAYSSGVSTLSGGASTLAVSSDYVARINYCDNLTTVNEYIIPARVGTTKLEGSLFNVKRIGVYDSTGATFFLNASSVKSIEFPEMVENISRSSTFESFGGTGSYVNLDKFIANGIYTTLDNGNLLMKGSKIIAFAPYGITEYTIPDGVSSIGGSTYLGNTTLVNITIPDSVTSIGEHAFQRCTALERVVLPSSITKIEGGTFNFCVNLTNIEIPTGITTICSHAFSECRSLISIIIPDSVLSIEDYAFTQCWELKNVTIGSMCEEIGESAFGSCDELTDVIIKSGDIGNDAFYNCPKLNNLTLGDKVTRIGAYAFNGCSGLTEITIPDSVTGVWSGAFRGCSNLSTVTIGKNALVSYTSFENCENLDKFIADGQCTTLDNGNLLMQGTNIIAFAPHGITEYAIPDGVTSIGDRAFCECANLTGLTIPNSVVSIGAFAFAYCEALTEIIIPDSVTNIGNCAFYNCFGLEEAVIGNGVKSIPIECFSMDTSHIHGVVEKPTSKLTTVTVGSGVSSIEDNAFYNCTNLTTFNWVIGYDLMGVEGTAPANEIITSSSASIAESATLADAPTNIEEGISFEGWSDGTTTYQPGDAYTFTLGNRKLKAVWSVARVTFDPNGGEGIIEPITADKSAGIMLPDGTGFSKEDHTFLGWASDPSYTYVEYYAGNYVYESMKLYAVWKSNKINITFNPDGGVGDTQTIKVTKGDTLKLAEYSNLYTRDGYVLLGWNTYSGSNYAQYSPTWSGNVDNINSGNDVTLYAVWQKEYLTITFDSNGGDQATQTVEVHYQAKVDFETYSSNLTKDGYVLLGWNSSPGVTSAVFYPLTYNITAQSINNQFGHTNLYAIWRLESELARIEFELQEAGVENKYVYAVVGEYTYDGRYLPNVSTCRNAAGQAIMGWSRTPGATSAEYRPGEYMYITSSDFTAGQTTMLYPVWTDIYTAHFNANGGTGEVPADMEVYPNGQFTLPECNLTREGYTFAGWDTNATANEGGISSAGSTITFYGNSDKTYYAIWIQPVNVIFDLNGGTGTAPESVVMNFKDTWTNPDSSTFSREGYIFKGWAKTSSATYSDFYDGNTTYFRYGDVTVYAVWEWITDSSFFGSLQAGKFATAQGIWAGKTSLTSEELNALATATGYNSKDMTKFMPKIYKDGIDVTYGYADYLGEYRIRGYRQELGSATYIVEFPNALPTGWKLIDTKFNVMQTGEVTVVDGKAQAEFTYSARDINSTAESYIFVFLLPDMPDAAESTVGYAVAMPGNYWTTLSGGTSLSSSQKVFMDTGFSIEIYNADNDSMLWTGVLMGSSDSKMFNYNFVTGNYKIVVSTENIVGVLAANHSTHAELDILKDLNRVSANGKTTITFSYTYNAEDDSAFKIVFKMNDVSSTNIFQPVDYGYQIARKYNSAVYDNTWAAAYRAVMLMQGFTNTGTPLTDDEVNYGYYAYYLVAQGYVPQQDVVPLSHLEIWGSNGKLFENPQTSIAFVKGETYTFKSKDPIKNFLYMNMGASKFQDYAAEYNEESGMYEVTFTVDADASQIYYMVTAPDVDLSKYGEIPAYDPNTDYLEILQG